MCHVLLCQFVLTPPILLPVYWLICPTCLPSLPSSFAPFKISLCLQFRCWFLVSFRMSCVLPCLFQPCPALPACQSVFPLWGCFCLFYLLLLLIKRQFFLLQLGPRSLPITRIPDRNGQILKIKWTFELKGAWSILNKD